MKLFVRKMKVIPSLLFQDDAWPILLNLIVRFISGSFIFKLLFDHELDFILYVDLRALSFVSASEINLKYLFSNSSKSLSKQSSVFTSKLSISIYKTVPDRF